ncbi:MAG: hypothetical protein HY758_00255, partial [Nitrospirae bacterium]|nr:hypothetical protein [Nitrospirota bacterium]
LKSEIISHLDELRKANSLCKGAGGDTTNPIDKRAEDIVLEEVEKINEPLTIVSEECGIKTIKEGGLKLLLDPIDGSRNALSGVPLFSTSIAVVDGATVGDTLLGYVINLISGDEFWAIKGGGSFCNDKPILAQQDGEFRVIAYEAQSPKTDIPKILPLLGMFRRARCFGSTAIDLSLLAQGSISVFTTPSPSRSFDFAAGYLLVREAGGIITDLEGNSIAGTHAGVEKASPLLASGNEELHRKALEVLKTQMIAYKKNR